MTDMERGLVMLDVASLSLGLGGHVFTCVFHVCSLLYLFAKRVPLSFVWVPLSFVCTFVFIPPCLREVKAFVFVFEPAHRIVVEWCVYGTAAYVFEMEEPLPVDVQVRLKPCCTV